MSEETENASDICEWLGRPVGAGRVWLTPLREAYRKECGAQVFLNYAFSVLGVAQAHLDHFGSQKLTGQISANFDLEKIQELSDTQLDTAHGEIYLDFPGNWRFAVCCFKTEESPYPVCRGCLYGPGMTHYYPTQEAEGRMSYVSLEEAVEGDLIFAWLREAVQTYMQQT